MKRNKITKTIGVVAPLLSAFYVVGANADLIKGDFNQAGPGWAPGVAVSGTSSVLPKGIAYVPGGDQQLTHTPIIPRRTVDEDTLKQINWHRLSALLRR